MKKIFKIFILTLVMTTVSYTQTSEVDELVNKINEELIKDKKEKKVLKSKEDKLQGELERLKRRFNKLEVENKKLKKRIKKEKAKNRHLQKKKRVIIKDKNSKKKVVKKKVVKKKVVKKKVVEKKVVEKKRYSPPIKTGNNSITMSDSITVTLAEGENLEILAKRYYGDSTKYNYIKNANKQIKVGKELIIPGLRGE